MIENINNRIKNLIEYRYKNTNKNVLDYHIVLNKTFILYTDLNKEYEINIKDNLIELNYYIDNEIVNGKLYKDYNNGFLTDIKKIFLNENIF